MTLSKIQLVFLVLTLACTGPVVSGSTTAIARLYSLPTAPLTEQEATDALTPAAPITFSAKTNNGWTLLAKFYHPDASFPVWEPIIEVGSSDGSHSIRLYHTSVPKRWYFWYKSPNTASMSYGVCYAEIVLSTLTENTWTTFVAKYDGPTETWVIDFNGQLSKTHTCIAGSLMDTELTRIWPVRANFAGMRLYDSVLSDAEMASELDKICVPADTCADVLTAGCDTAPACPVPIAPVFSLPPTTKLDYPSDNYAHLLTTPIQLQAEANGGFAVLGKFFFASSDVQPWGKLFQLRNFNLQSADALHLQIQMYQSDTAATYSFQIWKDGTSCQESFAKPATDNAWYTVEFQYSTVTDSWYLKLNDVLVAQTTCNAGWVENFQLNRVIVASQNWAGLRLYDSLLTDEEVGSELDKICVPADTCADVLTAGCNTAPACPESEETDCDAVSVSYWSIRKSTC